MTKKLLAGAVAAAVAGLAPMTASAVNMKDVIAGNTDFTFGGYVKLTAMASDYSHADIPAESSGRLFYIPSTISTTGSDESGSDFDMHARETRFNFKTVTKMGEHTLTSYLELDFLLHTDGNEVVSNSYSPRMRHAFLKYDNWLFGQTWSNYMDLGSLPESVDFLGPSESVIFNRQAQVRYTNGNFSVALENPSSFGGTDRDDNELPDLTLNYTHKGDFGHLTLSGVLSQNKVETSGSAAVAADTDPSDGVIFPASAAVPAVDDDDTGWGITLSGKIKVGGKDDLRFQIGKQEGVGRYTGLGIINNVVVDSMGNIDGIESTQGYIAYRHFWTDNLRSNLIYSAADVNDSANGTDSAESWQLNLMYSPVKPVTFGIMYLDAEREDSAGNTGDMKRVQAIAKYDF